MIKNNHKSKISASFSSVSAVMKSSLTDKEMSLARQILDINSDGWWEWRLSPHSSQKQEIVFSSGFARILGYEEYEVFDEVASWSKILHPADFNSTMEKFQEYMISPDARSFVCEFRLIHKCGQALRTTCQVRLVKDTQGQVSRLIGVHSPISNRRRVELALMESEARYMNLFESLPQAVVMVTHKGLIHSLNQKAEQVFGYPRSELIGRPIQIVVPIGFPPAQDPSLPNELVGLPSPAIEMESVCDVFGHRKDGSEFLVDINLNSNTSTNSVLIRVTFQEAAERSVQDTPVHIGHQKMMDIAVEKDHSKGIHPAYSAFMGEMSFQIRSSLAVVQGCVELLSRGEDDLERKKWLSIALKSAKQLGLIVKDAVEMSKSELIMIPPDAKCDLTLQGSHVRDGRSTHSNAEISEIKSLKDLKILIVEDAEDVRAYIRHTLDLQGAHVTEAVNGEEGVHLAQASTFDLTLMDLQMPILDGFQAIEKLRSAGSKMPIFALSARGFAGDRESCISRGFTDYLAKPLHVTELIKIANKHRKSAQYFSVS